MAIDTSTMTLPDAPTDAEAAERQASMLVCAKENETTISNCITEMEQLMTLLKTKNRPVGPTGLPTLLKTLQRERDVLRALAAEMDQQDPEPARLQQQSRRLEAGGNVAGHVATQWDVLRRCRGLVAVNQAFQGSTRDGRREEIARRGVASVERQKLHRLMKEQGRVEVDVVEGGHEWIVVKAVQRDRLARHLADCGWEWGEHQRGDRVDKDEWEDVPLARYVRRLATAARMNRHEYRFPRIRVVMANMRWGDGDDVDVFLEQLAHVDPSVEIIIEDLDGAFMKSAPPLLEKALERLGGGDEHEALTTTLNLDHTILIDLISDLTHAKLEPQPWQAQTTRVQIDEENAYQGGLMARTLYPVLAGRRLVCTRDAAAHFHEVLRTVGTETERHRGRLLVPETAGKTEENTEMIRAQFQKLSIHPLPDNVQVPVSVACEPWNAAAIEDAAKEGRLPQVAVDVAQCSGFPPGKLSVFMYGWAAGLVTVTSNREVSGQLRAWVEAHRRSDDEVGPRIWRVDVTRNLLAKNATPRVGFAMADEA